MIETTSVLMLLQIAQAIALAKLQDAQTKAAERAAIAAKMRELNDQVMAAHLAFVTEAAGAVPSK